MIYTAPCIIFWMRAYPLRGQVGQGLGPGNREFLGPKQWHRVVRRVPLGAQKVQFNCTKLIGNQQETVMYST
jgi:hypothetical protein